MLAEIIDPVLFEKGFKRSAKSTVYKRKLDEASQEINFWTYFSPRYDSHAAHIYPSAVFKIPQLGAEASRLIGEDKMWLPGDPDIVMGDPIDMCAPNEHHESWYATTMEDFIAAGLSIRTFMEKWLYGLLSDLQNTDGLIKLYESDDSRLRRTERLIIYFAAAYSLKGDKEKALGVMEKHLGRLGSRKRYAAVYRSLQT